MQVTFASTNQNKYNEVKSILAPHNISVGFLQAGLVEIQSDSLEEITREKAKSAYEKAGRPVIVEDDGLFIDALGGFPGQYSSYVFKTIGNAGILKLLEGKARAAHFLSIIAYTDGKNVELFEGRVEGSIAEKATQGGWGYDPVFMPKGAKATFAELANKNDYSHRRKALDRFAAWLKGTT